MLRYIVGFAVGALAGCALALLAGMVAPPVGSAGTGLHGVVEGWCVLGGLAGAAVGVTVADIQTRKF